jgi:hypothetical protein
MEKYSNIGSADGNKKNTTAAISSSDTLKSKVSFIQLKPILDIFFCMVSVCPAAFSTA